MPTASRAWWRRRRDRPVVKSVHPRVDAEPGGDDGPLLDALAGGDHHRALDLLMLAHGPAVFRFCLGMLHGDRALAEELQQATFVAAYEGLGSFRRAASARTWLFGIALHRCQRTFRRR